MTEPADTAAPPTQASRWLFWLVMVLGIMVASALLWIMLANRAVVSGADRRNQADLAIAAAGLEQWSGVVDQLARAHFVPGRVEMLAKDERDYAEGWHYRAWLRHPAAGQFKIVYAVTTPDEPATPGQPAKPSQCDGLRTTIQTNEGTLPFVVDYNSVGSPFLKVVSHFDLGPIWQRDTGRGIDEAPDRALRSYVANIVGAGGAGAGGGADLSDLSPKHQICFAAGIPLDRLLVLDKAARAFSNFLVVDSSRRVLAQIGSDRLPLTSLDGLAPAGSVLTKTLAATLGQPAPAEPRQGRLGDSLDPVDLNIGGRKYVAYIRPLSPLTGFDACKVATPTALPTIALAIGSAQGSATAQPPASATTAKPPARSDCLVVALVPKATIWRQVIGLPLVIGVSIGLAVLILIALVPSLRLILLGPGEAIGRAGAIGVALGVPAVASLLTLAILFGLDLAAHRNATRTLADSVAREAARRAGEQIQLFIDQTGRFDPTAHYDPEPPTGERVERNPQPERLPEPFCKSLSLRYSHLPAVDTLVEFDGDGAQVAGSRPWVCRGFAGGRANISAREYFSRLRNGGVPQRDGHTDIGCKDRSYVIDHVATLQDGSAKSIVAMESCQTRSQPGAQSGEDPVKIDKQRRFIVASATLTDVIAPVLPKPLDMMLVDTRSDTLPVLVHPTPGRSGTETLAQMISNLAPIRTQLRDLHLDDAKDGKVRLAHFTGFYDGVRRQFAAAPIPNTPWVIVVHYGLSSVDDDAANTAVQTLQTWAVFSILAIIPWLAWLAIKGRRGWPRLWPQRACEKVYDGLTVRFLVIAAGGLIAMLILVVLSVRVTPRAIGLLPVVGFLVRVAAAVELHVRLGRIMRPDKISWTGRIMQKLGEIFAPLIGRLRPVVAMMFPFLISPTPLPGEDRTTLRPTTQNKFILMLAPLLLCLSSIPMIGFWIEARQFALDQSRQETLAYFLGPNGNLQGNRLAFHRLRWAYGLPDPDPATGDPGVYAVTVTNQDPGEPIVGGASVSRVLEALRGNPVPARIPDCPVSAAQARSRVTLCGTNGKYGIAQAVPRLFGDIPWAPFLCYLLFPIVPLIGLIYLLVTKSLAALAGFGVPLDAITHPRLFLGDLAVPKKAPPQDYPTVTLNRRSLLVNAPWILLAILRRLPGSGDRMVFLNVAAPPPRHVSIDEGTILIVTGLEMVLADRERRLRALGLIERACGLLSALGTTTQARILILSEVTPLDRILDAFEREGLRREADPTRENLRWSRLFEDFATFSFAKTPLTAGRFGTVATDPITLSPDQHIVIDTVLEECRWLPPRIVNGAIGQDVLLDEKVFEEASVPIAAKIYQSCYREPLIEWAEERGFVGKDAVRSHLRDQFVEYYQKLWSSSTDAEHLVMHHLASQRFVNIDKALAFGSLVRRGIVVFDPAPQLMNKSFELFVRQAEKLDTIAKWRDAQPKGAWTTARWPIFAILGLAAMALIFLFSFSEEEPLSFLPLVAAGIPAIVTAVRRMVRQ